MSFHEPKSKWVYLSKYVSRQVWPDPRQLDHQIYDSSDNPDADKRQANTAVHDPVIWWHSNK